MPTHRTYVIVFEFPGDERPVFAGLHKGGWGFAPTIATAETFPDVESARRVLRNGYGASNEYGAVWPLDEIQEEHR